MSGKFVLARNNAICFAARFGFVTQDMFFNHLSPLKRSSKFSYWSKLQSGGWLTRSRSLPEVCYLTPASRKLISKPAVPARSTYFIQHDSIVTNLFLEISKSGLIKKFWTDYEITLAKLDAYRILGSDRADKFPDLIIDMRSSYGTARIAIEIERSQKSNARYDQVAFTYLSLKNIDLVLFGCNSESTARAVKRAFRGEIFHRQDKIPGIFLTQDFEKHGVEAEVQFLDGKLTLKELLLAALKLPKNDWANKPENSWTAVQEFLQVGEKAA